MDAKVLVAYATRYGSTREVAETIADELGQSGLGVDLERASEVQRVSAYGGVVLGAPLYMFRWHRDGRRFLARHRDEVAHKPVAVFGMGPFPEEPSDLEKELGEARAQLDKALGTYAWFQPMSVAVFGGKFDPQALRFPHSLIPALKQMPARDVRDWESIKNWARDVGERFPVGVA